MVKKILICFLVIGFIGQTAYAGLYNPKKDKKMGQTLVVKKNSQTVETTSRPDSINGWDKKNFKMTTRSEKTYDHNKDGNISGNETKMLLASRYNTIKGKNNPRVETEAEKFFDLNNDGKLNDREKDNIKRAITTKK
ncbi:MAG: hypothetical protein PHQ52_02015 [Candidatus Omnitrophica bacterium]|nr:hypothetical protein [Candidatus Omnitrophota bacterium]